MKEQFRKAMQSVEHKYDDLIKSESFILKSVPEAWHMRGIYLLSEDTGYLYVGRSNDILKRLRLHVGSWHTQATFAFLLAREATGILKPTYKKEGSRAHLLENPDFKRVFDQSRDRIKNMRVQAIEETDPTKQALLEIYTAFVAPTKYNSFDNH